MTVFERDERVEAAARPSRVRRDLADRGFADASGRTARAAARTAAARPAPARRRTAGPASPGRLQRDGQVERLVQQVRERVAGSMASGVSTGKISRRNSSRRCLRSSSVRSLGAADDDALSLQGRQHLVDAGTRYCSATSSRTRLARSCRAARGRHPVGPGADRDAGLHLLLQAADADHEELVEVRAEDGEELEPFQQRHGRVLRLFQDAAVELQPAQLAVDVQGGIVEIGRRANLHRGISGLRQFQQYTTRSTRRIARRSSAKPAFPHSPKSGIFSAAWTHPKRPPHPRRPLRPRRFSRRMLLRLAGYGAVAGLSLEAARVFAGSNEHTVIPGRVYRSAQLSRRRTRSARSPRRRSAR